MNLLNHKAICNTRDSSVAKKTLRVFEDLHCQHSPILLMGNGGSKKKETINDCPKQGMQYTMSFVQTAHPVPEITVKELKQEMDEGKVWLIFDFIYYIH